MKKIMFSLFTVSVFFLLVGCGESAQSNEPSAQRDAPHTFAGYPVVYLTADASAQGLLSAYEALEPAEGGTVGMILSETSLNNFCWSDLTAELTQAEEVSIIESSGANTGLPSYDSTIILTHFEPHDTAGFYGTVAHMASISEQQKGLERITGNTDEMMEYLAEWGKAGAESLNGPVLYLSVLDQWSVGDSTYGGAIMASYDQVSLDQACVDLVNMTEECQLLAAHIADCGGSNTLVDAEQIGWGSRTYAFLSIDP